MAWLVNNLYATLAIGPAKLPDLVVLKVFHTSVTYQMLIPQPGNHLTKCTAIYDSAVLTVFHTSVTYQMLIPQPGNHLTERIAIYDSMPC